jgi:hypothetical protein
MRIRDLPGWPPTEFQITEAPPRPCTPKPEELRLVSASLMQGYRKGTTACDLLMVFELGDTKTHCSTRLKVADAELGRLLESVLNRCKGLSLSEMGDRVIRNHPRNVSMDERD